MSCSKRLGIGVKSFLSEHVSQEPLKKYFGRQKQRGRVNENLTCEQFMKNNVALRIVSSIKSTLVKVKEGIIKKRWMAQLGQWFYQTEE